MKNTVIAIWGHGGQGKSQTVRGIYKELVNNHGAVVTNLVQSKLPQNGDVKVVLSIGNVIIGIESQGDPKSRVLVSVPEFARIGCNVIICATRTSGETVKTVRDTANNNGYRLIWSTNHRSNNVNQQQLNQMSVNQLTHMVMGIINGVV